MFSDEQLPLAEWHPDRVTETDPAVVRELPAGELDANLVERARAMGRSVVVLPSRIVEGQPVYSASSDTLVKQLRVAGVDAAFLDPPEHRTFEMKKSAELALLLGYVLGIASSASWDAIKALFRSRSTSKLSVTYVDLEKGDGHSARAWKVEGDSAAVLEAIDKLRGRESSVRSDRTQPEERNETPSKGSSLPAGADDDLRDAYQRQQMIERRDAAQTLLASAQAGVADAVDDASMEAAERDARAALALFARSLDWAEDTDQEENAHRLMDEAGEWVRRTFGCQVERVGLEYRQTCPVALAHNRIGFSVGGYAKRTCSLCGGDLSECEHLSGTAYLVPGGSEDLGWCRVCLAESCDHDPAQVYRASVIGRITEMSVEEISLVGKPAQPEARIAMMSIPASDLLEALGDEFVPGTDVSCDCCLRPCRGLTKHEAL